MALTTSFVVTDNGSTSAAPTLPPGFSRQSIATGLSPGQLVNFVFLPGGGMLTIGKCGDVNRVAADGTVVGVQTLSVNCERDRGLLGFELAADYPTSGDVYTLYNYVGGDGNIWARLTRWTVDDPTTPTMLMNEQIIVDGFPSFSSTGATCDDSHTIGTVLVGADDTLFVGNGDAASYCVVDTAALDAMDLTSPRGKIFRINTDGTGVTSNPFYDPADPSSWQSRVFASGVRNPFRFGLDPTRTAVYLGDVGWIHYEEINVAAGAGEFFGWPCWEGPLDHRNNYETLPECQAAYANPDPLLTAPLDAWFHVNGQSAAAVGGVFYESTSYPADYQGAFFYGDYALGTIRTVRTDANHQIVRAPADFGTEIGAPVAFKTGPSGDVYYADIATANIWRIRYEPGNRDPVAVATSNVTSGPIPLTVDFDGTGSYDLDDEPLTYAWDFGDGAVGAGPLVSHTYAAVGSYVATLTVTDQLGATGTTTITITAGNDPPVLTVDEVDAAGQPVPGITYAVGDTARVRATATDAQDGVLADADIAITSSQIHCPFGGACHAHPGPLPGETRVGDTWTMTIDDHGDDSYIELEVVATDSQGATATETVTLDPRYRTLTLSSDPAGVPIAVNATDSNTFPSLDLVAGSQNSITAPLTHNGLEFVAWSDGGPRDRVLTMPDADLDLVATYQPIPDVVPPSVVVTAPVEGAVVSGVVVLAADAFDDVAVGGVQFRVDGVDVGAEDQVAPFTVDWDASGVVPGSYVVTAVARDVAGNMTVSDPVSVTVVEAPVGPAGRVLGLGFNDGAGLVASDSSGNGLDGVLVGGPVWVPGRYGLGLDFDGVDDLVEVADAAALDVTNAFTVAAWVRPESLSAWHSIGMKSTGTAAAYGLYVRGSGAPAPMFFLNDGSTEHALEASVPVVVSQWQHFAVTFDGSTLEFYVDGVSAGSQALAVSAVTSDESLFIGGNTVWLYEFFDGVIDEFQMFDRPLSPAEIITIRDTPL